MFKVVGDDKEFALLSCLANARLIAAAPELLTFAYFVAAWLTAPELNRTTLDAVQRQARAAIAKATGGQP